MVLGALPLLDGYEVHCPGRTAFTPFCELFGLCPVQQLLTALISSTCFSGCFLGLVN